MSRAIILAALFASAALASSCVTCSAAQKRALCDPARCPGVSNAVCTVDSCKCTATFKKNSRTAACCPNNVQPVAVAPCSLVDRVNDCPDDVSAICKNDWCTGKANWFTPSGMAAQCHLGQCAAGTYALNCRSPAGLGPCDGQTCWAHPEASCNVNACGQCTAVWKDLGDYAVDCNVCHDGSTPAHTCAKNPCANAICHDDPKAVCKIDYCDCSAKWFRQDGSIAQCNISAGCAAGTYPLMCISPNDPSVIEPPCDVESCPTHPQATCVNSICGGCRAVWFDFNSDVVDCNVCPDGTAQVQCTRNPCQGATCHDDPSATCHPLYCGGCNTMWLTPDNAIAQCNISAGCAPGTHPLMCRDASGLYDPCDRESCPAHPDATCYKVTCGGCKAVWKDGNGDVVNCTLPPAKPVCPTTGLPSTCEADPCADKECPRVRSASCHADWCSCKATWTMDDQTTVIDCADTNHCTDGSHIVSCFKEPCAGEVCPRVSSAVCHDDYCGGCKFYWTMRNSNVPINCTMP